MPSLAVEWLALCCGEDCDVGHLSPSSPSRITRNGNFGRDVEEVADDARFAAAISSLRSRAVELMLSTTAESPPRSVLSSSYAAAVRGCGQSIRDW